MICKYCTRRIAVTGDNVESFGCTPTEGGQECYHHRCYENASEGAKNENADVLHDHSGDDEVDLMRSHEENEN